ncbi:nuclease-related domain-containing protein [Sutcliffiella horikoshii]|uniref:nuclease-related domain-containing protein n=1 Tax=Sutcliffiella horikoshii TaxID=79883 RepID=UPI003CF47EF8
MIILKEREMSLKIKVLEALSRRLPASHHMLPRINSDLGKNIAGFKGEESLNYYLELLPDEEGEFYVLQDIRLPFKEHHFQIDTLLIFPTFFLILDAKYMKGTLEFDPAFQQLIQKFTENEVDKTITYSDPIIQVQNQLTKFKSWLKDYKIQPGPCESLVVIANSRAEIKCISHPNLVKNMVVRNSGVEAKVTDFTKKHTKETWDAKNVRKLSSLIIKKNEPVTFIDLEKDYGVTSDCILKGVQCQKCHHIGCEKAFGTWLCQKCHHTCKEAHLHLLKDYKLLIGPTITVSEFQKITGIKNERTARRLLLSSGLSYSGNTSKRVYFL